MQSASDAEPAEAEPLAEGAAQPVGAALIQARLATLPADPGVYRMLGANGDFLYVGKARNLKKRVANYVHLTRLGPRLRRMVQVLPKSPPSHCFSGGSAVSSMPPPISFFTVWTLTKFG